MTRFKYFILATVFGFSGLFSSCKKFVEVTPPTDSIIGDKVFTDDVKATAAVTGIYGNMINGEPAFCNFLTTVYTGMASDELIRFNPNANFAEFMNNQLTPANTQVKNIWLTAYKQIYYANAALEGLSKSGTLSSAVKNQLTGECLFLRAFCHFYLTQLYGDVSKITTTDYSVNYLLPRVAQDEIMKFIAIDLEQAKSLLTDVYVNNEKGRPTKWAASALLARVYLYNREWQKAEQEASFLIDSGQFIPLQTLNNVFLKNSKETIWQLIPQTGIIPELSQSRPSGGTPRNYLSPQLLASFENNDLRRTKWLDSISYQSAKYYYAGKYKNTIATNIPEYYMMLRLSEQYLVRAEALANLNNTAGAIKDINAIRVRAGLSPLPLNLSLGETINAIEQERRIEFFSEWGHRWLDLKRTGRANAVLGSTKPNWQPTDQLLPIPIDDMLRNPNMVQNPGY